MKAIGRATDVTARADALQALEVYADQVEHQVGHLAGLRTSGAVLVPLELHASDPATRPNRRLLAALQARRRPPPPTNRFMTGPEPSWVRRRGAKG